MPCSAVVTVPLSSTQAKAKVPLSSTFTVNSKYGLAEIAGSRSARNTSWPLKVQTNELMISRGIGLPASSLRKPVSIGCDISVLIWMMSPFLASLGTRRRGFSAMMFLSGLVCCLFVSAAAAADRDLDHFALGIKLAGRGLGQHRDGAGAAEPDAGCGFGAPRRRRQMKSDNAGIGIGIADDADLADIVVRRHRAVDLDGERHGVAVLGDLGKIDRDLAALGRIAAGEFGDLGVGFGRRRHAVVGGNQRERHSGTEQQCAAAGQ